MIYLDTSFVIAVLMRETASARALDWLNAQNPEELMISGWVTTEVSSALSIKLRTGQLEAKDRAAASSAFRRLTSDSLGIAPITAAHFQMAAVYCDQTPLGLRAGNALHLAIAGDIGATVRTFDRTMYVAGAALGISVLDPAI